jgi:hypothetical protein
MTPALADQIASWRRVVTGGSPSIDARVMLRNAAQEMCTALRVDRTVHPESEIVSRQEAIDSCRTWPGSPGLTMRTHKQSSPSASKSNLQMGAEIYDFQTGAPPAIPSGNAQCHRPAV